MAEKACALELYNLQKDPEEKHNLLAVIASPQRCCQSQCVFPQEQPDARRPLVAQLRSRLMESFHEMATATYPPEVFVTRAVQNGSLATGWCQG